MLSSRIRKTRIPSVECWLLIQLWKSSFQAVEPNPYAMVSRSKPASQKRILRERQPLLTVFAPPRDHKRTTAALIDVYKRLKVNTGTPGVGGMPSALRGHRKSASRSPADSLRSCTRRTRKSSNGFWSTRNAINCPLVANQRFHWSSVWFLSGDQQRSIGSLLKCRADSTQSR